jgi:hypothetical protein
MFRIGDIVSLKTSCLFNTAGTLGVVYEQYEDFDYPDELGISVIFENGAYDGFSFDEQKVFLQLEGSAKEEEILNYQFTNVLQVEKDFRNGLWNCIFLENKITKWE